MTSGPGKESTPAAVSPRGMDWPMRDRVEDNGKICPHNGSYFLEPLSRMFDFTKFRFLFLNNAGIVQSWDSLSYVKSSLVL